MKRMPIGIESFTEMINENYYFVDKTLFIKDLLDNRAKVTLITRPRRFGKTLTLSMTKEFFDVNQKDPNLFDDLKIMQAGEKYLTYKNKYPVIFSVMKTVAMLTYEDTMGCLRGELSRLYKKFKFLLEGEFLDEEEKIYFRKISGRDKNVSYDELGEGLKNLCEYLERYYKVKPIILIDEYDSPIQNAWENGFYKEMIAFMRNFYSNALKTNESLEFAVLTGVLRVAKESIFSGLNNLKVCSVLSERYSNAFGFTGGEVEKMALELGYEDKIPEIKKWYDGYRFGETEIYNPWSIIEYFDNKCKPLPYWVNTSANGILRHLLEDLDKANREDLQTLISGGTIKKKIQENVIYNDIGKNKNDLYTILLTAGYLKVVQIEGKEEQIAALQIPNNEIKSLFCGEIKESLSGYTGCVTEMLEAMLAGDIEIFESYLRRIVRGYVSYHDVSENFYHGLMLGFCILTEKNYNVESNRESGFGRFDIVLIPKNKEHYGIILEFKQTKNEKELEEKARKALKQIQEKEYVSELKKQGIDKIWQYGIAFCGKKVFLIGSDI